MPMSACSSPFLIYSRQEDKASTVGCHCQELKSPPVPCHVLATSCIFFDWAAGHTSQSSSRIHSQDSRPGPTHGCRCPHTIAHICACHWVCRVCLHNNCRWLFNLIHFISILFSVFCFLCIVQKCAASDQTELSARRVESCTV